VVVNCHSNALYVSYFYPILIFARLLLDFYCIFYDVPCTLLLRVVVDHDDDEEDDEMLHCRLVWTPQTRSVCRPLPAAAARPMAVLFCSKDL